LIPVLKYEKEDFMRYLTNTNRFLKDPFQLLESFEKDLNTMNRLFGEMDNTDAFRSFGMHSPQVHWKEKDDFYLVEMEIPGAKKEDIELHLKNNVLSISGERRKGTEFQAKFERSFSLPYAINEADIQAHYEDGILQIALPKAEESKGRKIEIGNGKNEGFWTKLLGSSSEKETKDIPIDKH
jgi:HSP20 family protein